MGLGSYGVWGKCKRSETCKIIGEACSATPECRLAYPSSYCLKGCPDPDYAVCVLPGTQTNGDPCVCSAQCQEGQCEDGVCA